MLKSIDEVPDDILAERVLELVVMPPEHIIADGLANRKIESEALKGANKGAAEVHRRLLSHLSGDTLNPFRKVRVPYILELPPEQLAQRTRKIVKRIPERIEHHQELAPVEHSVEAQAFHYGAEMAYFKIAEHLTGNNFQEEEQYLLWDLEG